MQLHISKKFYTNLIQNEQSNIIIYMSHFSNIFFPFGMKSLIYNLPRLSSPKSLHINVFQCSSNHNSILSVTKKVNKEEVQNDNCQDFVQILSHKSSIQRFGHYFHRTTYNPKLNSNIQIQQAERLKSCKRRPDGQ